MTNNEEYAYLAGLFDGDGSCGIYEIHKKPKQPHHKTAPTVTTPTVQFKATDKELVEAFANVFGGKVHTCSIGSTQLGTKIPYAWTKTYKKACEVAQALRPYMLCKAKAAVMDRIISHYA